MTNKRDTKEWEFTNEMGNLPSWTIYRVPKRVIQFNSIQINRIITEANPGKVDVLSVNNVW